MVLESMGRIMYVTTKSLTRHLAVERLLFWIPTDLLAVEGAA